MQSWPRQNARFADRAGEIMTTLSNRSFLSLTIAGIVGAVGAGLASGLGLYIATYFWELSSKEISYLVALGFLSTILGVSLAPAVSKRMGKKQAMIALFARIGASRRNPDPPAAGRTHASKPHFRPAGDPVR